MDCKNNYVPGWMDGWVNGDKSRFKDSLQQSKILKIMNAENMQSACHLKNVESVGFIFCLGKITQGPKLNADFAKNKS